MRSYWRMTSPPIETDPFASVHRVEALVVGAGLTGLTTALMLARAGAKVAVLEARTVGAAATGNTTGKISVLQGTVLGELQRHSSDDPIRAYVQANLAGQTWLISEMRALGVPVQERDAYTYAVSAGGQAALEREMRAAAVAGLDVTSVAELGLPFAVLGAITLPRQAQVHPMQMLAALTAEARRLNVRIVERVRVLGIDTATPCLVRTSLGEVEADRVILATGVPILDRGLFFAKVDAVRSYAAAYQPPSGAMLPQGMYLSADEPRRSLRTVPTDGGEILITGGGGHITGRNSDTQSEVDALDHWTGENWPRAQRIARWSAQDHRTHTHVPFAGVVPRTGGRVYAATGYNKWGLTNAVAAAMTLAGDFAGDASPWAAALSKDGLGIADIAETVTANAEVAGHLVGDWARFPASAKDFVEDPPEGEGVIRRTGLRPVAVSTVDSVTCRVSGVCTHLGGVLTWNTAERSWDCPLHGSRFAPDGAVLEGPAVHDLAVLPAASDGA